ncbi:MAG: DUF3365 domain-containing protein [Myxococcales bacterium]|nr:DUF3365 domain-containing protein [Myxococcales bacterium]MCB9717297.1 DUF3365 domain-containing protein [Myxococcales bacterium]
MMLRRTISRLAVALAVPVALVGCRSEDAPAPTPVSKEAGPAVEDAPVAEARELTLRFETELKRTLLAAVEQGGPPHAITVCRDQAPAIAASMSTAGWTIGRTAARVRNPSNAANEWERRGLGELQAMLGSGEATDPKALEWHEVVEHEGTQTLHYMRAIPMGGLCLGCHGSADELDAAVKEQLAGLYPEDQATGFSVGELRGAFAVSRSL